jgi:hypothetical protein
VSTVVIAHLLTYKKLKNMEILKAVVLHLVIGFALTFYGGFNYFGDGSNWSRRWIIQLAPNREIFY